MIKPTMFDAFVNTMSKPHIARRCARELHAAVTEKAAGLEKVAKDILQKSGVDATVSCRVKKVNSLACKQLKYMKKFDNYESNRQQVVDMVLGKGIGELIGDAYGIRYSLNSPQGEALFQALKSRALTHPRFSIKGVENYYGANITPYATPTILDDFAQLTYRTRNGAIKHTTASTIKKPTGYTRVNQDARINGINTEIQIGGKYTNKWGDGEHFLYDIRQGKMSDLSDLTAEQKELYYKIKYAYEKLLSNPKAHDIYQETYLNKIWNYLRNSELKNLDIPHLPEFPKGFPNILRAENIMKLSHT